MEIITRRFALRDFTLGDLAAFSAYRCDARTSAFSSPEERTPEHAEILLQLFLRWSHEMPRRNFQFAVTSREYSQALLGCAGLRCEGYAEGQAELGLELSPDFWGRYRYAIEIVEALLAFGFRDLQLREIVGISQRSNTRIARLALRFGFEKSPTTDENSVMWRITREKWKSFLP